MQTRVHKLLVMVGEEGRQFEARDYKKLSEVIVNQYLIQNNPSFKNYLSDIVVQVTRQIPQKHHLYSGLTCDISRNHYELAIKIIESSISQLENCINQSKFYQASNLIQYLAEVMNVSLLNSLTFMNILDDILIAAQREESNSRKVLTSLLIRTLPSYAYSLNEKIYHQFKKYIEKLLKLSQYDEYCNYIHLQFLTNKLKDYSLMSNITTDYSNLNQYQSKIKLRLEQKAFAHFEECQYFKGDFNFDESGIKYRKEEGWRLKWGIEELVSIFGSSAQWLMVKIPNFVKYFQEQHRVQYFTELVICKSFKSKNPLIEFSIITTMASLEPISSFTKHLNEYLLLLFNQVEKFQYWTINTLSKLFAFLINNLKEELQWDNFMEEQIEFSKRHVLLRLILEKVSLMNDKFKVPKVLQKFEPAKSYSSEQEYQTADQMQIFENFTNELKTKSNSSVFEESIKSQKQYQIFLEALFRKTSLSQTHLTKLIERYQDLFLKLKQYDWTLINKIRNYFKNSFFHRLLYLKFFINKQLLSFTSYINYLGELKDKSQIEMIWIKIELNELNSLFGKNLIKNK